MSKVDAFLSWYNKHPIEVFRQSRTKPVTRAQFAALIGVSKTCVDNWVRGTSLPTMEHTTKIAEVMGVSPVVLGKSWIAWNDSKPKTI